MNRTFQAEPASDKSLISVITDRQQRIKDIRLSLQLREFLANSIYAYLEKTHNFNMVNMKIINKWKMPDKELQFRIWYRCLNKQMQAVEVTAILKPIKGGLDININRVLGGRIKPVKE